MADTNELELRIAVLEAQVKLLQQQLATKAAPPRTPWKPIAPSSTPVIGKCPFCGRSLTGTHSCMYSATGSGALTVGLN